MRQLGVYATIPFVLGIPPILGMYFGQWIDKKLGTSPYCMYILLILGVIAGFKEVYRIIRRYGNEP